MGTAAQPETSGADPHAQLGIYLRDHRAGASAGLSLARRLLEQNSSNYLTATLTEIVRQIDEDRQTLEDVKQRLGFEPSRVKMALAILGERLGRLKVNGRLRGYSAVSRLEEFEMLIAGIITKASLWRTLGIVLEGDSRVAGIDFDGLVRRAESQVLMLEEHRPQIANDMFPPDAREG